ncbi:MAG: prephenate dehydrogenase/arogenate dehydrogenase family protein [Clostridia bacterium]|nr:prephenate dehydrogenase/arogenate dehydrogenase family protein [Clostridia bacterium]
MNTAIIGLGLIGGSLARTIKVHRKDTVYGADLNQDTIRQALFMQAIDGELDDEKLKTCDMILVALYPEDIITWITGHRHLFREDALVIDCGGVKRRIVDAVMPLAEGQAWHYIGGHPMAGREFSGFKYAKDDLFDRASMILTPREGEDLFLLQRAREYFLSLGFRRVQFTTPDKHDEMIAFTSQLAHVVSSAYVKCPLAQAHRGFSAGSFADMTRVAKLSEDMWTELFFDNREKLLDEVDGLIDRLVQYRDALRDEDRESMRSLLREGREIKESLEE